MVRTLLTPLFVLLLCTCGRAQEAMADSLRRMSREATSPAERYRHYDRLIRLHGLSDSLVSRRRFDTLRAMIPADDNGTFAGRHALGLSDLFRYQGDIDSAKVLSTQAERFLLAAGDSALLATALYNRARLYLPARQYDTTLLLTQRAYELHRATNNQRGQVNTLNAMGMVQNRMNNPRQAIAYFEQALPLSQKYSPRSSTISVLTNLALAHQGLEDYDQAEVYFAEGIGLAQQEPAIARQMAYLRANLSKVYAETDRIDASLQTLELAIPWFEQFGSQREKVSVLLGLTDSYQKLGQAEKALATGQRVLDLVGPEQQVRQNVHDILAKAYRDLNVADSAYAHMERANHLREETATKEKEARAAELEARFQNREKQLEIDRLEAEEVANTRRIRTRSIIIGATLLGLILLGWLLLRNQRQRRRIEAQNKTISKALGEKELLLKEIHHRVKNNLQMVSSLLNMQTHYIEDEAAADALQLGRSRVRSMALIHQKLYIGDEVSTLVDAKDYLERLVQEIVDTHAPPATRVKVQLDVEPLELDIDTVVPLGLLTNEAVTNAVKYAFVGRETGTLQVRLWQRDGRHTLTVTDDGPGMRSTTSREDSFGQLLMTTLAEQLEGELETRSAEKGVEVLVRF
ncbi:MAG: histidine kinase dimerization/phosphoacceptor domain -containing protein [Bacteroidota bacterium]